LLQGKKIVLISSQFPPSLDGVGDYTWHLGKELEKEHRVYYFNLPKLNLTHWNFKNWLNVYQAIKAVQPDLISLQYVPFGFHHKGLPFSLIVFWTLLKRKGYNLQITFHEIAIAYNAHSLRQSLASWLQKAIACMLCKLSDHVFTGTLVYKKMLLKYKRSISFVAIGPNILPHHDFIADKNILTSFANRVTAELIRALAELKKEGIKLTLYALGKIDSDQKKLLLSLAKETGFDKQIFFYHNISNQEFAVHLNKGDIYLQLEHVASDGNGGVALKSGALAAAMAFRKAIISTSGSGTDHELLVHKKNIVFCQNHVPDIKDKIVELFQNDLYRENLKSESFRFHQTYSTWKIIANEYSKLIST